MRFGQRAKGFLAALALAVACWLVQGAVTWAGSELLARAGSLSWRNVQLLSMSSTAFLCGLYACVFRRFVSTIPVVGAGPSLPRGMAVGAAIALGTLVASYLLVSLWAQDPVHVAAAKVAWQPMQTLFVLSAAFNEELFFRGFVLAIAVTLCRPFWANVIQATLFTALHLIEQQRTASVLAFIFVGGLMLGALAQHFRSLVPSTLCHALINLASSSLVYSGVARATGGRGVASGLVIDLGAGESTAALVHAVLITLCLGAYAWYQYQARCGASVVLQSDAPSISRR